MTPAPTVRDALTAATQRIGRAGSDTARLDAEILLAHALSSDRAALVLAAEDELDPGAAESFAALVGRREDHEPIAYLVGRRGFRHIELAVDRRVLIPRPETELLVEVALDLPAEARVADVGTGSGAVALALAVERPDLEVVAIDRDPDALAVARENAARIAPRVTVLEGDLLTAAPGPFDAVLANLPYIPDAELDGLMPDVARHEPRSALAGGPDGLDVVRPLLDQAGAAGIPFVALEIGAGQADQTAGLLSAGGWTPTTHRDLAGIERVVVGER